MDYMTDFCAQGPTGMRFSIKGYEFRHYRKGQCLGHRWEASKNGRGVSNCKTPIHAFISLRKWMKEPAVPI